MAARIDQHWRAFLEELPWFLEPGEKAEVNNLRPAGSWSADEEFQAMFPVLSDLLRRAELTELTLEGAAHILFTWDGDTNPQSWLCPSPSSNPPSGLHPAHATLLRFFGGIVERANEPSGTWLLNQNDVLTAREAAHDASFLKDYEWAFSKSAGGIPIVLTDFYSIAREANGNTTLCHRRDGTILLFATDHAFKHVTPLAGCPEYSLYTLNGVERFAEWVNVIARQWSSALSHT
ncbi:MAG: hypothetical protein JST54_24625 [Deltaproteobacteria bacterium]|nr:hypothetical protein [Deltaproteobacteria bacterium]